MTTARGRVVLASDVAHFLESMETGRPFTTAFHVGDMLDGDDRLRALKPSARDLVPGRDPEAMRRYPAVAGLEAIAVELHRDPSA